MEKGEEAWAPKKEVAIRRRDQRFSPSFVVVTAGQSVRFNNEDEIYHRIFSYSESNRFDLGILRRGSSKTVTLEHPGAVRFYCSLHPGERGTIFVAPSPYFDTIYPPDTYEIRGVPPGRYRLRTWTETMPGVARLVAVHGGKSTPIELSIDGRSEDR
jgi:plastocyanin